MYQEVCFNRGTEAGVEFIGATRSAPPVILCLLRACARRWYITCATRASWIWNAIVGLVSSLRLLTTHSSKSLVRVFFKISLGCKWWQNAGLRKKKEVKRLINWSEENNNCYLRLAGKVVQEQHCFWKTITPDKGKEEMHAALANECSVAFLFSFRCNFFQVKIYVQKIRKMTVKQLHALLDKTPFFLGGGGGGVNFALIMWKCHLSKFLTPLCSEVK